MNLRTNCIRAKICLKVILIGNIGSGKSLIAKWISKFSNYPIYSIDAIRMAIADGTVAGEYDAYSQFLRYVQNDEHCVLEFSGVGVHKHAVRYALEFTNNPYVIVNIASTPEQCLKRIYNTAHFDQVPYPFPISVEKLIILNSNELLQDNMDHFWEIASIPHMILYFDNSQPLPRETLNSSLYNRFFVEIWKKITKFHQQLLENQPI
ncbi:hypothetical protein [Candidatus Harpocratesius sp.]